MKSADRPDMNEASPISNEQSAFDANGKRSLGLQIRSRVGMDVKTSLRTGDGRLTGSCNPNPTLLCSTQ
jgi:hypothetical protein